LQINVFNIYDLQVCCTTIRNAVCLFARLLKTITDYDEFFGVVERGPKNNRLDFGGDRGHDSLLTTAIHTDSQE